MSDNTTLNLGVGGNVVRDIDRLGAGVKTPVVQIDFGGGNGNVEQLASASNPLPVFSPGAACVDHSANKPSLPNVGANFGATGPYANFALIATVAANPARQNIDVENTSGGQIVIIRDDGTASSGSAPNNASVFSLAGGVSVGAQGGSWSSATFKWRLQIYALSTVSAPQVAIFED